MQRNVETITFCVSFSGTDIDSIMQTTERLRKDVRTTKVADELSSFYSQAKKASGMLGKKQRVEIAQTYSLALDSLAYSALLIRQATSDISSDFEIVPFDVDEVEAQYNSGRLYWIQDSRPLWNNAGASSRAADALDISHGSEQVEAQSPQIGNVGHLFLDMKGFTELTSVFTRHKYGRIYAMGFL